MTFWFAEYPLAVAAAAGTRPPGTLVPVARSADADELWSAIGQEFRIRPAVGRVDHMIDLRAGAGAHTWNTKLACRVPAKHPLAQRLGHTTGAVAWSVPPIAGPVHEWNVARLL